MYVNRYLAKISIPSPPKFLTQIAVESFIVNLVNIHHQQQDNLIMAWLFGSMSPPMLTKMVSLHMSAVIWQRLALHLHRSS